MEFDLKGALKKYRRMRSRRRFAMWAILGAAIITPLLLGMNRPETLICLIAGLLVWTGGEIEMRLKTIQVRLAGMEDRLNDLRSQEPEGNLILELNDW